VELGEIDVELADGPPDQGDQQAGAVGAGEVVEGTSDAVVVEEGDLPRKEAEVFGDAASGPVGDGIERLAGEQEVGQQDGEADRGGQSGGASGQRREVLLEQGGQVEPLKEEPDKRRGPDLERLETKAVGQGRDRHGNLATRNRGLAREWDREGKRGGEG
jgi:hypothetical protein